MLRRDAAGRPPGRGMAPTGSGRAERRLADAERRAGFRARDPGGLVHAVLWLTLHDLGFSLRSRLRSSPAMLLPWTRQSRIRAPTPMGRLHRWARGRVGFETAKSAT